MKQISQQKRLEAFALFTLAQQHYAKTREFERGIARALGSKEEFLEHVSDALYSEMNDTFDEILNRSGYAVKARPRKSK